MVASTYGEALKRVLIHEGGNDDDPADPGGRTSRGITKTDWNNWRATHPGLPSDVWAAPQASIVAIYREKYWDKEDCDELPAGLDYCVFDYGVNSGTGRSSKVLQRLVGANPDGEIGPDTIKAVKARDPKVVITAICDERLAFLHSLSTWPRFGGGWGRRVADVRAASMAMAGATQAVIPSPAPAAIGVIPSWLGRMNALLGLYEFPGATDNPAILAMAKTCGGQIAKNYKHDAIPWCALTINYVLISAGLPGDDSLLALDFRKYGQRLKGPAIGAIATKTRDGGGHVFLVVGRTLDNRIVGRGGNQADMVCDEIFDPGVLQYNWPLVVPLPEVGIEKLPIVVPAAKAKRNVVLPPTMPALSGKGTIEAPKPTGTIVTGTGVGTIVAGSTWWDWLLAHPIETAGIAFGVVMMGVGVFYLVRSWHASTFNDRQDAPTPGIVPIAA